MKDAEKVKLIRKLIEDFWNYHETEDMRNGAVAIVTAISTIADFEEEQHEK